MTAAPRPIVLTAGGTGGHVFPAQALAGALQDRGYRIVLIADKRSGTLSGPLATVECHRIHAGAPTGRNVFRRIGGIVKLASGFLQARRLLRDLDPEVVVGFGSYASVPAMAAAIALGQRTVIHEQNAVLGRANRLLAPRVTKIATAFQSVAHLREEDASKCVWTGNPVRPEVIAIAAHPFPTIDDTGPIDLLVFGGSQGATIFSSVVPEALACLPDALRRRLRVVQQCRQEDLDPVRRIYNTVGIQAELAPFFDDMPRRLGTAHLVICRSGASTCAELTAAGRPAILVPFPHATDDHQTRNAERLCDAGAGWMIPQSSFTAEALTQRLTALLQNPLLLRTTALCAGRIGMRSATAKLADLVVAVIECRSAGSVERQRLQREAAE